MMAIDYDDDASDADSDAPEFDDVTMTLMSGNVAKW